MTKHNNYKSIDKIKIIKISDDKYSLEYDSDGWGLIGTREEIIEEISEHLANMKTL